MGAVENVIADFLLVNTLVEGLIQAAFYEQLFCAADSQIDTGMVSSPALLLSSSLASHSCPAVTRTSILKIPYKSF